MTDLGLYLCQEMERHNVRPDELAARARLTMSRLATMMLDPSAGPDYGTCERIAAVLDVSASTVAVLAGCRGVEIGEPPTG